MGPNFILEVPRALLLFCAKTRYFQNQLSVRHVHFTWLELGQMNFAVVIFSLCSHVWRRIRPYMKENYHSQCICGFALVCEKQGWLCYEFLLVYLIWKSHAEILGFSEHLLSIPLSCFFPLFQVVSTSLRSPIDLLVPPLILNISVSAGSVQLWTGRIVSAFQLPPRFGGRLGKGCWCLLLHYQQGSAGHRSYQF